MSWWAPVSGLVAPHHSSMQDLVLGCPFVHGPVLAVIVFWIKLEDFLHLRTPCTQPSGHRTLSRLWHRKWWQSTSCEPGAMPQS